MNDSKSDVEKSLEDSLTGVEKIHISDDPNDRFEVASIDCVQRRLKQRHVQMIAIAGTLGTGLFLGSGQALSGAGPLGALIAYTLIGSVAYSSLCAIGEMTSLAPISGTFPHFAARWVDPALGFALGWNYYYSNIMGVPVEISGAQILITYWDSNPNHAGIYIAVICVCVSAINIFGVQYFAEAEFFFSLIKITMITGLILLGVILDIEPGNGPNGGRLGFHYWKNPGVFNGSGLEPKHLNLDRFLGVVSVLVQAAFSYQSMELVAVAASETQNPRRNIAKAVRRVFYRIFIFYILGLLITGLLVPYNDPSLLHTSGTAADSPYVLAMTRAGIKILPGIINAGIMTSAFSASNSFLFCASRVLYGLALRGQAPRIFARCTKNGLPIVAVLCSAAPSFLALMSVSNGAETIFTWFVSLTTVGGFFGWASMNLTYLFFYRGLKAQGIDRKKLYYWSSLQPYLSIWGFTWCTILILINGFEVFWNFTAAKFITSYINLPIFFSLFMFWKITKKTKVRKPAEMDFVTGIPPPEETESPEVPPRNFGEKVAAFLF
ncbi:amino acid permease/ SLC12A domain-containing protein [Hygrophoropsis aurantiaca]|uniref:Amino acid permease/ SLC12A domain-containing protein n=1 Tax=Hygrophoropsis aurantiaca TaxID=72124 RepID=A0ACB8AA52_9AGAM|nr:amino acid permease/ SLC12A domain-containing protein [Hygrophoropsis aurantiaca]